MRWSISWLHCVLGLAFLFSVTASAADAPRALAAESLEMVGRMDALLDGAIRGGSPEDFERFIAQPTRAQMNKWPPLSDEASLRYRRCQFAVDAFRVYADDSFAEGARLDAARPTARDYAEQKALCKQSIK